MLRRMSRSSIRGICWGPVGAHKAAYTRRASRAIRPASLGAAAGANPAPEPSAFAPTQVTNLATTSQLPTSPPPSPPLIPDGPVIPLVASAADTADLPYYSQYPLDRHAEWRKDARQLDNLFARSDAKLVPLMRDKVLVRLQANPSVGLTTDAGASAACTETPLLLPVLLCPASEHAQLVAGSPARAFLGTDATGAPYFAIGISGTDAARDLAAAHQGAEWRSARVAGPDLSPGDASLLAVASGLMVWHGGNGFSPSTGAPSTPSPGGFSRKCTAGGSSTYPRIDPAVIMLVTHGEFGLLGRKAEWPTDRYSTLAGFLELGEPLELAVARETEEEAGVRVDLASVTYCASQPWPFPRSLMIGFTARASTSPTPALVSPSATDVRISPGPTYSPPSSGNGSGGSTARSWWQPASAAGAAERTSGFDLLPLLGRRAALDVGLFREEVEEVLGPLQVLQWPVPDSAELQDARWFHRDWVRTVFRTPGGAAAIPGGGSFNVPGPYSLAYRLITGWAGCTPYGTAAAGGNAAPTPPAWSGDLVPQVLISDSGTFKYVLMRLWDPRPESEGRSKLLVWGDTRAPYHNDVLQKAKALARPLGLQVTPLGGGRMDHHPAERKIQVYGYSAAFGPAPHEVAAALVHRWYPLYDKESITVSYEGY